MNLLGGASVPASRGGTLAKARGYARLTNRFMAGEQVQKEQGSFA